MFLAGFLAALGLILNILAAREHLRIWRRLNPHRPKSDAER